MFWRGMAAAVFGAKLLASIGYCCSVPGVKSGHAGQDDASSWPSWSGSKR